MSSAASDMDSVLPRKYRTLVLCFDGTSNQYDGDNTNVVKFFSLLKKDDFHEQLCYYQAGIGTYFNPGIVSPLFRWGAKILDEAVAWYLDAHVMDGYKFLMDNYRVGDKICLFGFSRGAYTARALAGMLSKVGLLPKDNSQQVPFAYKLYTRTDKTGINLCASYKQAFSQSVNIDFVGVWDTVASVGIVAGKNLPFVDTNTAIKTFRHALSLDEHRAKFRPNLYHRPAPDEQAAAKDPEHASPVNNRSKTSGIRQAQVDLEKNSLKQPKFGWKSKKRKAEKFKTSSIHQAPVEVEEKGSKKPRFVPSFGWKIKKREAEKCANRSKTSSIHQAQVEVEEKGSKKPKFIPSLGWKSKKRKAGKYTRNGKVGIPAATSSQENLMEESATEPTTDALEVWFSGCHSDVGGGAVTDDTIACLSQITLRWMVREVMASQCGIQFDDEALSRLNIPTTFFPPPSSTVAGDLELELDQQDALQPLHDELKLSILWWLLEIIPTNYACQNAKGVWYKKWSFHLGGGRKIHDYHPNFHVTVQERMADTTLEYKPKAVWNAGSEVYVE